jgi:hypothetical protein
MYASQHTYVSSLGSVVPAQAEFATELMRAWQPPGDSAPRPRDRLIGIHSCRCMGGCLSSCRWPPSGWSAERWVPAGISRDLQTKTWHSPQARNHAIARRSHWTSFGCKRLENVPKPATKPLRRPETLARATKAAADSDWTVLRPVVAGDESCRSNCARSRQKEWARVGVEI